MTAVGRIFFVDISKRTDNEMIYLKINKIEISDILSIKIWNHLDGGDGVTAHQRSISNSKTIEGTRPFVINSWRVALSRVEERDG